MKSTKRRVLAIGVLTAITATPATALATTEPAAPEGPTSAAGGTIDFAGSTDVIELTDEQLTALEGEDEPRRRGLGLGERSEERPRRLVGPMEVLEDEHRRDRQSDGKQLAHRSVEPVAVRETPAAQAFDAPARAWPWFGARGSRGVAAAKLGLTPGTRAA